MLDAVTAGRTCCFHEKILQVRYSNGPPCSVSEGILQVQYLTECSCYDRQVSFRGTVFKFSGSVISIQVRNVASEMFIMCDGWFYQNCNHRSCSSSTLNRIVFDGAVHMSCSQKTLQGRIL